MPPDIQIPEVPKFLGPDEWKAKQEAERAAVDATAPSSHDQAPDVEDDEAVIIDGELAADVDVVDPPAQLAAAPDVEDVDQAAEDSAYQLVQTSDTLDQLFRAMMLAARMNANDGVAHLAPSIGTEYTRIRLALESLRAMIGDEDTADTLGPVAVGIIDHLTGELLAWLDGSRAPFDGTPVDLND